MREYDQRAGKRKRSGLGQTFREFVDGHSLWTAFDGYTRLKDEGGNPEDLQILILGIYLPSP